MKKAHKIALALFGLVVTTTIMACTNDNDPGVSGADGGGSGGAGAGGGGAGGTKTDGSAGAMVEDGGNDGSGDGATGDGG
jgi:hypothetical protein